MSVRRGDMYETWEAVARAANAIIPDLSVSLADLGEGVIKGEWLIEHGFGDVGIPEQTLAYIKESTTLYYAWHWYGAPADPQQAVDNALAIGDSWNVPTFLTEGMNNTMYYRQIRLFIQGPHCHPTNCTVHSHTCTRL